MAEMKKSQFPQIPLEKLPSGRVSVGLSPDQSVSFIEKETVTMGGVGKKESLCNFYLKFY